MNRYFKCVAICFAIFMGNFNCTHALDADSQFDEAAIATLQAEVELTPEEIGLIQSFETVTNEAARASIWEELIVHASGGFFQAQWPTPEGGWTLLDFSDEEILTMEQIRNQPFQRAHFTKLIARDELEAVKLRGAGGLIRVAVSEGEEWGELLILDIAAGSNGNLKKAAYYFAKDFGDNSGAIEREIDWDKWCQTYNEADDFGKAIILRNIAMLAGRANSFEAARSVSLSALESDSRELKAIALAFGDPSFGAQIIEKWELLASNDSDPQIQSLAQEALEMFVDE